MTRTSTIISVAAAFAVALAVNVAIAGPGHGDQHGSGFAGGRPGDPAEVDRTVRITAGDTYFDRQSIEIRAGETVRFVVTNKGELEHDFTLGTPKVQKAHRAEMARRMSDGGAEGHADPNAVMIDPGETASVIWTFERTERFLFACNVPGHFEAGMQGEIDIRPVPSAGA
ncbi:plastocyanin/azurin family copper-binding protein [Arhodomonas sp. KWT]|uniref:cupredoxin domain-containing protein n=1 Tax=Arhodomonas sp. KWT TaxID=2679915 RepID=UPI0013D88941|nr:plastocyanin/azurin family copper-binding protein [Arhodomonas sp. KWT]